MPTRFTHDELVDKALAVLRETAQQVRDRGGPVERSAALRFALAFLANGHDERAYVLFWQEATRPAGEHEAQHPGGSSAFGRLQSLGNALGWIHRLHGREPG